MAVAGSYIAWRARTVALPHLRAYGDCAREQVVPLFGDIGEKADEVAQAEYERLGSRTVGEDFAVDMGDLAERAQNVGLTYYETMVGVRQSVLNLLAVGLFHLIEQELADLCRDGAFCVEPPRDSQIEVVADWYQLHFLVDPPRPTVLGNRRRVETRRKFGEARRGTLSSIIERAPPRLVPESGSGYLPRPRSRPTVADL